MQIPQNLPSKTRSPLAESASNRLCTRRMNPNWMRSSNYCVAFTIRTKLDRTTEGVTAGALPSDAVSEGA
jgi:hypothetical protein